MGEITQFPKHGNLARSSGSDHSGGMPPDLEPRIAKLEAVAEHIQGDMKDVKADLRGLRDKLERDFRIGFGALIVVALGLAGMMAKGFKWL